MTLKGIKAMVGKNPPDRSRKHAGNASNTPLVISFVSVSGAGKTSLLEKLVPELKKSGLKVGVLKHHAHPTTFDVPGKDTYRMAEAGADIVVGACSVQTAIFIPGDGSANLEAVIQRYLAEVDLVLVEGYKRGKYPKIEVYRADANDEEGKKTGLLCDVEELLAVVTNVELPLPETVLHYDLNDAIGIANFLFGLVSPE